MKRSSYEERAEAAWGQTPSWVLALARACDRSTQMRAAEELGVPQSYVSWAIRGERFEYHARVETAVRARLMGETVECPILGELSLDRCRDLRRRTARPLGPVGKALREVCPHCPRNPERGRTEPAPDEEAKHD